MDLEKIKKIDNIMRDIFEELKETNLSDLDFSILPKTQDKVFEIVKILEEENIKTTYNNLTNMNYHTLVKILNYNWFFDKQLPKKTINDLKQLPI